VLTATFRLPGIFGLATGGGAAWATTGNAVLRIDGSTDQARQVLSDPGASLTGIAFGAGSLWVEDAAGILRVDPATGKVTARIGVHASLLSFGEGALWALRDIGGGPLVRIDPATNAVRAFPLPPGKSWDLAVGEVRYGSRRPARLPLACCVSTRPPGGWPRASQGVTCSGRSPRVMARSGRPTGQR